MTQNNKPLDVEKEIDEQINSILNSYSDAITDSNYEPKRNARPKAKARIKALLQTICLEIVGEDEIEIFPQTSVLEKNRLYDEQYGRNTLRATQRENLTRLLGGKDE